MPDVRAHTRLLAIIANKSVELRVRQDAGARGALGKQNLSSALLDGESAAADACNGGVPASKADVYRFSDQGFDSLGHFPGDGRGGTRDAVDKGAIGSEGGFPGIVKGSVRAVERLGGRQASLFGICVL
jgi:hypothetical protein